MKKVPVQADRSAGNLPQAHARLRFSYKVTVSPVHFLKSYLATRQLDSLLTSPPLFTMVLSRVAARSLSRPTSSLISSPHLARRSVPSFQTSSIPKRTLTASASRQGKVLLVLYDVSTSQPPPCLSHSLTPFRVTTMPNNNPVS